MQGHEGDAEREISLELAATTDMVEYCFGKADAKPCLHRLPNLVVRGEQGTSYGP